MKKNNSHINNQERHPVRVSDVFPAGLFWDVDVETLSVQRDKNFIIQRVLNRADVSLFKSLEKLYPLDDIKFHALNSKEIFGNERIEHIAARYRLNPGDFHKYIDFALYEVR